MGAKRGSRASEVVVREPLSEQNTPIIASPSFIHPVAQRNLVAWLKTSAVVVD